MLRGERPVVEGRTLPDEVASTGVRMLQDELPVVEGCRCWRVDATK